MSNIEDELLEEHLRKVKEIMGEDFESTYMKKVEIDLNNSLNGHINYNTTKEITTQVVHKIDSSTVIYTQIPNTILDKNIEIDTKIENDCNAQLILDTQVTRG